MNNDRIRALIIDDDREDFMPALSGTGRTQEGPRRGGTGNPAQEQFAKRTLSTINELLAIGRFKTGKILLKKRWAGVHWQVERSLGRFR